MMMSEFIDRTGFEPTGAEYREIEEAYNEFDGDKDRFCRKWVKEGGANRLARQRAMEIERLEREMEGTVDDLMQEIIAKTDTINKIADQNTRLRRELDEANKEAEDWRIRYRELEVKMVKIQEVFAMLTGKDA